MSERPKFTPPDFFVSETRGENGMFEVVITESIETLISNQTKTHSKTEGARPGYGKTERRTNRGSGPKSY